MNINETYLLAFLVGTSAALNLHASFKDICKNLTDNALYHIKDTALEDWQSQIVSEILTERSGNLF